MVGGYQEIEMGFVEDNPGVTSSISRGLRIREPVRLRPMSPSPDLSHSLEENRILSNKETTRAQRALKAALVIRSLNRGRIRGQSHIKRSLSRRFERVEEERR